jgi:hypothetical protein
MHFCWDHVVKQAHPDNTVTDFGPAQSTHSQVHKQEGKAALVARGSVYQGKCVLAADALLHLLLLFVALVEGVLGLASC